MNGSARLTVINTALAPRRGTLTTKWQPIREALGTEARSVRVFDGEDRLDAQIDRIDPDDPTQDELTILLNRDVPAADSEVTILRLEEDDTEADANESVSLATATVFHSGVKLRNATLTLWINCTADIDGWGQWFGGAVTSIELLDRELLDCVASRFDFPHDPEKRCMQVDRLQIPMPPWSDTPFVNVPLFDRPWRIVSVTNGPVRATATIASSPFELYTLPSPGVRGERFLCSVYRTLALKRDAASVHDTMWLKVSGACEFTQVPFWFSPHYFMYADFGVLASPSQPAPQYLIVTADSYPPYGYAVAATPTIDDVRNPPADFPGHDRAHRAFGWRLEFTRRAEAVHLFAWQPEQFLADEIGSLWYDEIYNPLRIEVR
jgi:hypothetical protein